MLVAFSAIGAIVAGWMVHRRRLSPPTLLALGQIGCAVSFALQAIDSPTNAPLLLISSKTVSVLSPVILYAQVAVLAQLLGRQTPQQIGGKSSTGDGSGTAVSAGALSRALALIGGSASVGMFIGGRVGRLVYHSPTLEFFTGGGMTAENGRGGQSSRAGGGSGAENVQMVLGASSALMVAIALSCWMLFGGTCNGRGGCLLYTSPSPRDRG